MLAMFGNLEVGGRGGGAAGAGAAGFAGTRRSPLSYHEVTGLEGFRQPGGGSHCSRAGSFGHGPRIRCGALPPPTAGHSFGGAGRAATATATVTGAAEGGADDSVLGSFLLFA